MFNSSNGIKILLEGEELYEAIIAAISDAKRINLSYLGRKSISPEEVTSASANPLGRKATLFKFFHKHKSKNNKNLFSKSWIEKLWEIRSSSFENNVELKKLFTADSKDYKITNQFKGSLKRDFDLILHMLWENRAILLPITMKMPLAKGGNRAQNIEFAAESYSEVLQIFKKSSVKHVDFGVIDLTKKMPEQSIKNYEWYAWRMVRAATWYTIEDITSEDLNDAWNYCLESQVYPFQIKFWFTLLAEAVPQRTNYDVNQIGYQLTQRIHKQKNLATTGQNKKSDAITTSDYVPKPIEDKLKPWLNAVFIYGKKQKAKGHKTWDKMQNIASFVITYLIHEVYPKCGADGVPLIHQFDRSYIDGFNGKPSLLTWLSKDVKKNTYQSRLYRVSDFFDFLELYDENGFRNRMSSKIDFPIVRRGKGTEKKTIDQDYFSIVYKFTFAIADWYWHLTQQAVDGINLNVSSKKLAIETCLFGFVPFIIHDGKVFPIKFVPIQIAPLIYRQLKDSEGLKQIPTIHYLNLTQFMLETGIRHIHVNWLDRDRYDELTDRETLNPYDFLPVDILINTDKVNGEWCAQPLPTALLVLDRQKEYQSFFPEPELTKKIWYDGHEDGVFGKFIPLFALGAAAGGHHRSISSPPSHDVYTSKWKALLYVFNLFAIDVLGLKGVLDKPLILNDKNSFLSMDNFEDAMKVFEAKNVDITPHSIRATVVSEFIPILPPSEIKKITGHASTAHLLYYAKIDKNYLKKVGEFQKAIIEAGFSEVREPRSIDEIDAIDVDFVSAKDINEKLRNAFRQNREGTLHDYGAVSNTSPAKNADTISSGINVIKNRPIDNFSFNNTHICPFNNECPKDVVRSFPSAPIMKPCGACFYSVKTVDHLPSILGKIRAYTDENAELEAFIKQAKSKGVDSCELNEQITRRKFLSDETVAWISTVHCLDRMRIERESREQWLVQKPELLNEHLIKVSSTEGSLSNLLLKASEARAHAEYFTPTLKNKLKAARSKILAHTQQYQLLLKEAPEDFTLIDEFRGQVKSICDALNINVTELSEVMQQPLAIDNSPRGSLALLNGKKGDSNE
ncbi:hypothetical protein ACSFVZ_00125 [Pseudoalteromonas sp. SYSU M81236]|uniref:hypothetical protein n=1 Tax=Pseudoalteromonas sp. SYSU M81236 TaxID=3447014 RepID=UPI003F0DF150